MPALKAELGRLRAAVLISSSDQRQAPRGRDGARPTAARARVAQRCCSERLGAGGETDAEVRAALQQSLDAVRGRLAWGERLGVRLHRRQPRLDPAAGRARPGDHLRPDGRHQHGARRADDDRRLRDLRRAEPVPRLLARARSTATCWSAIPAAFLVAALVGAVLERSVIRCLYGRPLETLLATWGISLVLHAGGALDLRRAERAGREPGVAVGRRRR